MQFKNLYTSHNLAIAIKQRAKHKSVILKDLLEECNLGSNTMSALYHGKSIAFDSLARIADYLDCSVDYLLGRTDVPEVNYGIQAFEETKIAAYGLKNDTYYEPEDDNLQT